MYKQIEITSPLPLHNSVGRLTQEGWARRPYWKYDRKSIGASNFRIKEWDYYSVLSDKNHFGITLTMSDLGYAGLFAICFLDFEKKTFHQVDTLSLFPLGKIGFPPNNNSGTIEFSDKKLSLSFESLNEKRKIHFSSKFLEDSDGNRGLDGEITLYQPEELESLTIATSWKENRKAFYYNTKINCMPAEGNFQIGNQSYQFNPDSDFGALDWGRGVWTYKNRWYWSSASGYIDGKPFGFNLGYGFTDRTPASENVLIYNNKIHKLDLVTFEINTNDYLTPWKFHSNDNRLELDFQPLLDRNSSVNFGIIKSIQHQVFGKFSGKVILDDGSELFLKDFLGFAEDVLNHY